MSGAFSTLVRHFAGATLAPDVLTDTGSDHLRRLLFGLLAVLLVLGIFVTRLFFDKYTTLGALVGNTAYLRAVQADSLLMIALPMALVGLAAVAAGPLLFPGETDYRVLTPLPISRALLFGAKLAAVVAIVTTAILTVNMVATFWFPLAISGRKAQHSALARVIAHGIGATAGSFFMCITVMAVQGLTIVAVPAAWQRRTSVVIQTALWVGLLVSFSVIGRLPAMDVTEATIVRPPLAYMPWSWFFGVERWWLDGSGAGGYVRSAQVAAGALLAVTVIVASCYTILYRSAERLAGISGADRRTVQRPGRLAQWFSARFPPPTVAIIEFIRAGLGRSRLHQFVFMLALGIGIALLVGQMTAAMDGLSVLASQPRAAIQAALSAPLLVGLTFVLGLRAAYRWPLDRGASWIFRMTEVPRTRHLALNGAALFMAGGAWLASMITALVVQPRVLGVVWWPAAVLTSLALFALVEFMLLDWHRIPFACTYLPGTRVLAYHLGALAGQYFVVVIIGSNLIRWAILAPPRTLALAGFLIALWAALRRERRKTWGLLPLEFEDDDPAEVSRLRL